MFRPPSLLASQIVPTAVNLPTGRPRRLRPSRTCVVTFARIGYAIRLTTGNWRNEDFHLARFSVLSAAPYLCESFPACLGPCHGGPVECICLFLPPRHRPSPVHYRGRLPAYTRRKRFHDGSLFRDCSHSFMFRPSGLLASPIVPTAATYRRRAAEAFTSEPNMLRCLRMHRICLPPAQAIGGVGTYTPLDSQPCRLLQ